MEKKVVGKQAVDYISKKTNQPVVGVTLHTVGEDSRIEGMAVETIFVSKKSAMYDDVMKFPIGATVEVSYNRWGSADTIRLCKQ